MKSTAQFEREMQEDEEDGRSREQAAGLLRAVAALEDQIRGGAVVTLRMGPEKEQIRLSIDDEDFEGETLAEALTGIPGSS